MAEAGTDGTPFVLNQHDDITVNCFSVKGGTFVGFNPASVNEAKGAITSFVAEGYRAVETTYNGKQAWKVEAIPAVTTQEGLNDEITNGTAGSQVTINLAKDATFTLNNGIANEAEKSRNVIFLGDGTQTMDVITRAINAEGGQLNYQRGSSFTFKILRLRQEKETLMASCVMNWFSRIVPLQVNLLSMEKPLLKTASLRTRWQISIRLGHGAALMLRLISVHSILMARLYFFMVRRQLLSRQIL